MKVGKYGRVTETHKYWAMVYDNEQPDDIDHVISNVSEDEVFEFFKYCGIDVMNVTFASEVHGGE